jgi:hypothetical protein
VSRRSRRASSAPQKVGSDEGLTSSRPRLDEPREPIAAAEPEGNLLAADRDGEQGDDSAPPAPTTSRPPRKAEQSRDDTDEGWGERGDGDASARWLRENRPPHWG